jgi:D-3-phosphoglycerate dehydrogenase
MDVLAFDPYVDANAAPPDGVEFVKSIGEMLPHCHALSLHCPAQRGMPPIIDAEALALLPQGAVIINTARGELIDEAALVQALRSGRLGAAALDTFATEPLAPDSALLGLDNVILTPHVAGSTPDALAEMAKGAAANILTYLDAQRDLSIGGIDASGHSDLRENCLNWEAIQTLNNTPSLVCVQ